MALLFCREKKSTTESSIPGVVIGSGSCGGRETSWGQIEGEIQKYGASLAQVRSHFFSKKYKKFESVFSETSWYLWFGGKENKKERRYRE